MTRCLQIFIITVMTATGLTGEVIYRETFDQGNGSTGPQQGWTVGKNTEINRGSETWHKNILGYMGWGAPLEWTPEGGRSGGYAPPLLPGTSTITTGNSIGFISSSGFGNQKMSDSGQRSS